MLRWIESEVVNHMIHCYVCLCPAPPSPTPRNNIANSRVAFFAPCTQHTTITATASPPISTCTPLNKHATHAPALVIVVSTHM